MECPDENPRKKKVKINKIFRSEFIIYFEGNADETALSAFTDQS